MSKVVWKPGTFIYPIPAVMVTCGTMEKSNIITVAWTGILNTDPAMVYISVRPSRCSYEMIKNQGEFVINLTTKDLAKATDWCGCRSGKDYDKFKETGLTPEFSDGTVYIKEAKHVLILKTLAVTEMTPDSFLDKDIDSDCYPNKDYHIVYIAEIVKTLEK